jgi:hypothetical protein
VPDASPKPDSHHFPLLSPFLQALRLMKTFPGTPPSTSWRPLVAVPTSPVWARVLVPTGHWGMGDGTAEDILRLLWAASSWGSLRGPPLRLSLGVSEFAHPLPYTSMNTTSKPSHPHHMELQLTRRHATGA